MHMRAKVSYYPKKKEAHNEVNFVGKEWSIYSTIQVAS